MCFGSIYFLWYRNYRFGYCWGIGGCYKEGRVRKNLFSSLEYRRFRIYFGGEKVLRVALCLFWGLRILYILY